MTDPGSTGDRGADGETGTSHRLPQRSRRVPHSRPRALVLLIGLVLLQVLGMLVVAAWYLSALLSTPARSVGGAVFTLVLLLAVAGWQASSAVALGRGRRWARAAVLVWQFFLFAIAVPTLTGGFWGWALLLGLPPLVIIYLLFRSDVVAVTTPAPAAT